MNVVLLYDPTWKALEWAKINCPSYVTNYMSSESPYNTSKANIEIGFVPKIIYVFDDEREATLFALRWA